jgi:hypothetical protein
MTVPRSLRIPLLVLAVAAACKDDEEPAIGVWRDLAPLGEERNGVCLVPLLNGRVLAIGGMTGDPRELKALTSSQPLSNRFVRTTSIYDPATDIWTDVAPTETPHAFTDASGCRTARPSSSDTVLRT